MAAVIALSGRLYWLWGLRGLDGVPRQWASVERLAGWAGFEPGGTESARRWGSRVGESLAREEAADELSAAYEETRYGPPDLERVDAEETAGRTGSCETRSSASSSDARPQRTRTRTMEPKHPQRSRAQRSSSNTKRTTPDQVIRH